MADMDNVDISPKAVEQAAEYLRGAMCPHEAAMLRALSAERGNENERAELWKAAAEAAEARVEALEAALRNLLCIDEDEGIVGDQTTLEVARTALTIARGEIVEEASRYAEQLAVAIAAKHYPDVPEFQPLSGDLIGLLTQIDNMTAGMSRSLKGGQHDAG